jgi:iron complex outermembrane recepter protein
MFGMFEDSTITSDVHADVTIACWVSPRLRPFARSLGVIALMASNAGHAQQSNLGGSAPSPSPDDVIPDVVVTAQRRQERLMDVPVSVSAISGATLAETGIRETRDITQLAPGITFNDSGPNDTFAIRGVSLNDDGDSNESPIAFYRDDVYIAALGGIQSAMFDVNRVEVLRGPQGTLFGRNATGGVVQLISNKPTDTYSGAISVQYGSYNQVILNGAFGGPINDSIRERTAFTYDRDDGWQHNLVTDTRAAKANNWAVRELVDADLTDKLTLEFNVHVAINHDVLPIYGSRGIYNASSGTFNYNTQVATGQLCTQTQVIALARQCTNFFGFRNPNPTPTTVYSVLAAPASNIRNYGGSATLKYAGGWFDLTSISAYEYSKKWYNEDGSPGPELDDVDPWGATRAQISQELRASGELEVAHWTAGLYYFTEHLTDGYWGIVNLVPILGTYGYQNQYSERTNAGAAYAQADYKISPEVTVTTGIRYSEESKTLNITDSYAAPTYFEEDKAKAHATTWKAALEWKFVPDWMTYASISTGFKSPGFNTTGVIAGDSVPSKPEHITTYEIGLKGSFWDNRVKTTSAIYYNHYKDFQLVDFVSVPGSLYQLTRLINIPLARTHGAELDVDVTPIRHLNFDLNASYTESKIVAPGIYDGPVDLNGAYVTNTPKQTVKATIEYHWENDAVGTIAPRISADYQASFAPYLTCEVYISCIVPAYAIANSAVVWTPPSGKYHIEAFANNLFNKAYETGSYYYGDINALIWGRPRMVGARFYTHW